MAQDMFTAPCGCIWHGGQHQQACAAWQALNATRDELRQGGSVEFLEVRRIEDRMSEHMPPWMSEERA